MWKYESLGKASFELKWSKNGELTPLHQIIQELQVKFSYCKNGIKVLLKDSHSISKRYLHLQAEAQDDVSMNVLGS